MDFNGKVAVVTGGGNGIGRACALQAKLYSNGVMAALGSLKSLPAVPRLYQQLCQELDGGNATPKSVAAIIEQDMSMTLRLLQLVNSAFFGLARKITNIREAVTYLGFEPIQISDRINNCTAFVGGRPD